MSRARGNLTKGERERKRKAKQEYKYSLAGVSYTWYESISTGALILLNPSTAVNSTPCVRATECKKTLLFEGAKNLLCFTQSHIKRRGAFLVHYWSLRMFCLVYVKSFVFCQDSREYEIILRLVLQSWYYCMRDGILTISWITLSSYF